MLKAGLEEEYGVREENGGGKWYVRGGNGERGEMRVRNHSSLRLFTAYPHS
jgi:hypothetical protein